MSKGTPPEAVHFLGLATKHKVITIRHDELPAKGKVGEIIYLNTDNHPYIYVP